MAVKLPNPKYIPKPYEQMQYPGQIDKPTFFATIHILILSGCVGMVRFALLTATVVHGRICSSMNQKPSKKNSNIS